MSCHFLTFLAMACQISYAPVNRGPSGYGRSQRNVPILHLDEVATTWARARADLVVQGHPARIPPTYRENYPGLFWFSTNRRQLIYESILELDRLWLADFGTSVNVIRTQPFQLAAQSDNAQRTHVPDILLTHADQRVTLLDVKPKHLLDEPSVRKQFEWTRVLCEEKAWHYEIFSGGDSTVLRNIKMISLGRRPERLLPGVVSKAREKLRDHPLSLSDILNSRPRKLNKDDWYVAVLSLIWSGAAGIDMDRRLSTESVLQPSGQEQV
ncbi:MAG: TnsA-like heteromeric transposase endonuclease subunit [Brevibacterium sp.]|uniref:TnsA-like heteromeric transposase endonuclease subunit n=1 Tax=Brevibacterium TaxID=1696 RepID=UPI003F89912F